MKPCWTRLPHIDLLPMARRVFKLRLKRCRLADLEAAVLGCPRLGDLPGREAPERYFQFLKTGRFELLEEVLRHNAQDIASLCVLLPRMTAMYEHPEKEHQEDIFSMGLAMEKNRHPEEARRYYRLVRSGSMRALGQTRLAESYRRTGDRQAAKRVWLDMAARREGGVLPYIELAKHYEHVERDLQAALEMTRQALVLLAEPTLPGACADALQETRNAVQYRYDRLQRRQKGK